MSAIVEIRNLEVEAGKKKILNDINLEIHKNSINTILGPSGGGKSTLLKVLNRLTELDPAYKVKGNVQFNGKSIYDYNEIELRRKIGMIFQRPNPFPLSIYDNVAFGMRLQSIIKKDKLDILVKDSLEDAGLYSEVKENLRRSAQTLSGGQQQRMCIARALILQPEIIMMDEPTSSLDPTAKARIEDLMLDLKEDYTVILVTHDISQSRKVSDYTSLIYNGKIVASGEGEGVYEGESDEMKLFLGDSAQ